MRVARLQGSHEGGERDRLGGAAPSVSAAAPGNAREPDRERAPPRPPCPALGQVTLRLPPSGEAERREAHGSTLRCALVSPTGRYCWDLDRTRLGAGGARTEPGGGSRRWRL